MVTLILPNIKLMKKLIIIVLLALPLLSTAQFSGALKAGNAIESAKFLNSVVQLNWMGTETQASSLEVTNQLKNLFDECTAHDFRILHNGESGAGLQYAMGELMCGEISYNITYYFTSSNGIELVEEFIIEKK